ncbi:HlyC/CorC family transporter [Marinobacter sp. M3C]|uniref:HlyC/CorC family transporter n=1 Tax=unclassified Marinobacter TaxID=83889 RepID=UPI00200E3687|nr:MULTISPECIES: HlyC/CorC family transporter [unclassified Marinobacter]MCL1477376.1 HlyC/CorC family transporter [Marinobacter sp.]MCL1482015.1 HlyC/CorC family transporter [Marinobacter sp.]MCL1488377.1 HlyC/CorC family transporter [Marinobacter sp.]UQG57074.1 HlyC/CorC family transporter [Marinobacter sp. M4C]UQG61730.1 HlyC/CorC family transporter [Marinobacter sp. M3C]
MNETSLTALFITLAGLILLSAFFSSSETGMMSLNRYRLKHMAQTGHKGAKRAHRLLQRTDQLIGVILIGNNFVNIFASAIATVIAIRIWGDAGIAIATVLLTIVILIFAEVTPKTLAALFPEKIAFPASYVLAPLLKILYPVVWAVNLLTGGILKVLRVSPEDIANDHLSREELRTLVNEAGALIPAKHKDMLVSILDLEKVTVTDIMVPRNEVVGIDLDDDLDSILRLLRNSQHTRLPVYKGDINEIQGILHLRNTTKLLQKDDLNKDMIVQLCTEPYFVPESTPLNTQLINFQKGRRRFGIVVDEYGEVLGLATLEDILEEIVGEFTTDYASTSPDIIPQDNGTYIIDGTASLRVINKSLSWKLPLDGPKTLNGLITETLENIPDSNVCLRVGGHRVEVLQIKDNVVKAAIVHPKKRKKRGLGR